MVLKDAGGAHAAPDKRRPSACCSASPSAGRRRLYHFTAATESHLGSICRERSIRTTESNISPEVEDYGPRVVWLSSVPDPERHRGTWTRGSILDKTEVRLTVEVPKSEACAWEPWARRKGCPPHFRRGLQDTGGGGGDWYVIERPVWKSEIVEMSIFRDGCEFVWPAAALEVAFACPPEGASPYHSWPPRKVLDRAATEARPSAA